MAEPNFAAALRQRNFQTPGGVAESALPDTGGGIVSAAGLNFQRGSVPNFVGALEQMPNIGIMADTPQFVDPGQLRLGQVFGNRLGEGTDQTQQLGGALLKMLGRELGSNRIESFGQGIIDRNQAEIDAYMPSVHSLGEIEDFDDFLEWAVGGLGQAVPSLGTALAGGGVGGIIGRQVVKRRIANELTDRTLGSLTAAGFTREAAEQSVSRTLRNPNTARILRDHIRYGDAIDLRRGAMRGAGLGTFIPSSGMMTGEAEQAGVGTGGAILAGVTGGLLETAVLARAVRRFFPGVDKSVADNFIKDFAKATGSQAILEGSQEGAQQMIQMAALAYHDPSFNLLDPENSMQVIDSFAIGALVGATMGAGGSAVGNASLALRERGDIRGSAGPDGGIDPFTTPDLGPSGPDSGLPPDFEPADNTFAEEIRERVNRIMQGNVTPAMNTIQSQVAAAVEAVTSRLPGARSTFASVINPVRQVNDEFIEGSRPVVDDIRRYAGEQVAYIVETAEQMPVGPMRDRFINESLAETEENIAAASEELAGRGEQLAETAANRVRDMRLDDIFDNDMFVSAGADPEFTFGQFETLKTRQGVSYQRPTRGDRAKPIKTRKSAENRLRQLREAYPSATEDSFQIVEVEGGFLITLADQLQRDVLLEDEVVTQGVQNARTSARGNPDTTRQVKLENKSIIDVPTLAFQGRRLDRGDNQSLAEAFAAITGRMLDRGTITDQDFVNMTRVFEEHFSNDEQLSNVRMIAERQAAIDRGDFEPTGPRRRNESEQARERRLQREREREARQRYDALEGQERRAVTDAINQVLDDRGLEGTERGQAFNALLPRAFEQLDNDPASLRNLGQQLETEDPNDFGFDSALQNAETEEQQAEASRDRRNPKERDLPPGVDRDEVRARQRKRLARQEAAAKSQKKRRKKPTMRTPNKKVATRRPPKDKDKRGVVWFPGNKGQRRLEAASKELVDRVLALVPESKTELRVVNREAIRQMIKQRHPDAYVVDMFNSDALAQIIRTPGRPTYIMVPDNEVMAGVRGPREDFDSGIFLNALAHELGHFIHFETWETLSRESQDEILKAFRDDVKKGQHTATMPDSMRDSDMMQDNSYEFGEWMADQFVDWMMDRKAPKNALERFLEKVARRVEAFWNFISLQPGRYGMLNDTYGDFVDTLAKRARNPEHGNDTWFKEGQIGRSLDEIFYPPDQPISMKMSPQQVERLRTSLEKYPKIARNANKMIEFLTNAYYTALAPSTSRMRDLSKKGIKAADELVRMFNRQPHGTSKVGRQITQNYHQAREQMQGMFMEKVRRILDGISEGDLFRLGQELRAMDGNRDMVPTTIRGKGIRRVLDEIHEYMKEAGLPVGKIDNYFPRTFDREKLIADEQEIIAYLTKVYEKQMPAQQVMEDPGAAEARARKTYNGLISNEADAEAALRELGRDPLATQVPTGGFMRTRVATDKFFGKYYNNDVESVMANYINVVTKRAEYNRLLGQKAFPQQMGGDSLKRSQWDPKKRLRDILRDAKEQGATEDELMFMKNYVEANIGMYGRDFLSEPVRKAMAGVIAYQNMRTLLFSVFASLPDAMGPAIRSGQTRETFKTLFKNINDIRRSDGGAAEMARTWGIISDAYNQHVLTEYVDNHYMPKGLRRWNDRFFKYTGLNWWTDFTRKAALAVGVDSIQNEALKAQTAPTEKQRNRAKQFLGELGLTVTDVNKWVARGKPVWGSLAYTETNSDNQAVDRRIANSLVQFVDESILRPNPSQRPMLANHPALMLVYHLKGFMYAIHDTILKRLAHNFRIADTPARIAAVFVPAVGMMLMTALGLELRELVTGTRRTDKMDGWEYTWEVFERTGLPGLTQFAWDWNASSARGQSELAGLGGPAISQAGDLLSKPTSQTIPKGIPIVSQLPWARDALREATPL